MNKKSKTLNIILKSLGNCIQEMELGKGPKGLKMIIYFPLEMVMMTNNIWLLPKPQKITTYHLRNMNRLMVGKIFITIVKKRMSSQEIKRAGIIHTKGHKEKRKAPYKTQSTRKDLQESQSLHKFQILIKSMLLLLRPT